MINDMLTLAEVAVKLRCSERTVRRLSCCMFGPAGKLGGVLLIEKVGLTA